MFSLAPIGCSPIFINKFGTYGKPCVQKMNEAVTLFNDRLKALVHTLNHKKSDAKFTFINLGSILSPLGGKVRVVMKLDSHGQNWFRGLINYYITPQCN